MRWLGGILVGVLLLVGCSATVAGVAAPAPDGPAGEEGPGGRRSADLAAVAPCDLLTAAQLSRFGLAGAVPVAAETGALRSCTWAGPARFAPTVVALGTGVGLPEMSAAVGGPVEDLEVAGLPAARASSAGGACSVLVAVADDAVLSTISADGCGAALRLAEAAVGNLAA